MVAFGQKTPIRGQPPKIGGNLAAMRPLHLPSFHPPPCQGGEEGGAGLGGGGVGGRGASASPHPPTQVPITITLLNDTRPNPAKCSRLH